MARPPRIRPFWHYVEASLASADPFYHGEMRAPAPAPPEEVRPLDPEKTARDLGRLEDEHTGSPDPSRTVGAYER